MKCITEFHVIWILLVTILLATLFIFWENCYLFIYLHAIYRTLSFTAAYPRDLGPNLQSSSKIMTSEIFDVIGRYKRTSQLIKLFSLISNKCTKCSFSIVLNHIISCLYYGTNNFEHQLWSSKWRWLRILAFWYY